MMCDQILEPVITRYKDEEIWGCMRKYEKILQPDITRFQDDEIWLVHTYPNTKEKNTIIQ